MEAAEHMLQAPLQQLGLLCDELVLMVSEPLAMHLDGFKDILGLNVQLELIVLEDEPNLALLSHHSTSDKRWMARKPRVRYCNDHMLDFHSRLDIQSIIHIPPQWSHC